MDDVEIQQAGTVPDQAKRARQAAVLGSGTLTVAVAAQRAAATDHGAAEVDPETFAAYETLTELARSLGLQATTRSFPDPAWSG